MPNIISNIKVNNTDHGIRAGYMYYGTTEGTESALAVGIRDDSGNTISIPELIKGMTFALTFHVIPSTSATLSVNGLTGKPIHFSTGLTGKEWVVGETYVFIYNGVTFVAISSYDDYTVTLTGSGNAITSISKSGRSITATKGSTFLTEHPIITKSTDTTSAQTVAHSGTFTVIDNVTRDGNGHVTKVNTKTVTLPSSPTTLQGYQGYQGTAGTNGVGTQGYRGYQGTAGTNGSVTAITSSGSGNVVSSLSLNGSQVTQTFTNCVPGTNNEATIATLNSDTVIPKTINGTSTSVGLPTNQYGAVFAEFGVFDKLCTLDGTNATSIHVGSSIQPVYFEDGHVKPCNMNLTGPQGLQGYQGYQGKAGTNGTNGTNGSHAYSYINHIGLISGQWNVDELDQINSRTYAIWELTPDTNNLGIFNMNAPLNFEHYLLIRNGFGDNLEIVIALDGDFGNADIYADIDTSNSIEVPQNSAVEICYFASLDKTGKKYVTITKSAPLSNSPQLY